MIVTMLQIFMVVLFSLSSFAYGQAYPAFTTLSAQYNPVISSQILVKNMPGFHSQDGFPGCGGWAASTIFLHYQCKEENKNCPNPPPSPKDIPSPLFMSTFGIKASANALPFSNPDGHSVAGVLQGFKDKSYAKSDSCYPFDQFVSDHKNDREKMKDLFLKLKTDYDKSKSEGTACIDCLVSELNKDFSFQNNNVTDLRATVTKALSAESFDKFLYAIFMKDCKAGVSITKMYDIQFWPPENTKPSFEETMNKVKSVLNEQRPFTITSCLTEIKRAAQCSTAHGFVISGYRKYCKGDGKCREALRVHNSWGMDWQKENNDGWVDAETLYNHMKETPLFMNYITPQGT